MRKKKVSFSFIPRPLIRLWVPAVIGIAAMLLLSFWFDGARYILFSHHVFWVIGTFLLLKPVTGTFWPSAAQRTKNLRAARRRAAARTRRRAEAHWQTAAGKPAPAAETPTERLARLRRQEEAVDREIGKLVAQNKK